jgi:hypothetical protein
MRESVARERRRDAGGESAGRSGDQRAASFDSAQDDTRRD